MKLTKEIKETIAKLKLSDEEVIKRLSVQSQPDESDTGDEPEEQTGSEESDEAEEGSATEAPDVETITKIVAEIMAKMVDKKPAKEKPATRKPSKVVSRAAPRPKTVTEDRFKGSFRIRN